MVIVMVMVMVMQVQNCQQCWMLAVKMASKAVGSLHKQGGSPNHQVSIVDFQRKRQRRDVAQVPIVSEAACQEALLGLATILPGMLCAGCHHRQHHHHQQHHHDNHHIHPNHHHHHHAMICTGGVANEDACGVRFLFNNFVFLRHFKRFWLRATAVDNTS